MTTPPRVVVINDTEEILELFRDILTEMGCDVALMSYAPDDLHRIEQERPDLVVIDFVLGGREFEGWQLLQKLRMNRATESVPIIACTAALQQVRDQEGYLLEQNVTVVLKPFNVDQLEAAVRKALPMLSADGS
jgi:DNA-binding response OmpR family regulator